MNFAQTFLYGYTFGITFSFGNKIKRVGIGAKAYYGYDFIQLNAQFNLLYNFQSLVLNKKTPEIHTGIGVQIGMDRKDTTTNRFIGLIDKNIPYNYSIGYTYLHYWDYQNTSQGSGILNLNIKNFTLATQNDLFGWGQGWRDRFRTGAFLIQYRYLDFKFGLNASFWTGDYTGCTKITDDKNYPARYGYYLNDKGVFTDKSAGLFSFQIDYLIPNIPYQQTARLNVGIDSEKIRHIIQNKLMHDMPFYTEKMVKRHLYHYPMLNENGNQYLFKAHQTYKKPSFYYNVGLNEILFY